VQLALSTPDDAAARLRRSTFWTLLVGYGAYYLCRANLGVAAPFLQRELHLDKQQLGLVTGVSTLVYATGKLALGPAADLLGGRRVFLLGLAGSVAANVAFGLSGSLAFFVVFWSANRLFQSAGWMGLVQLVSSFYERREHGVVMAWLSLSFLFGDVAARAYGAALLGAGLGWRALFFVPAATCALFLLVARRTLHAPPRPTLVEARASARPEDAAASARLREILRTLARSPGFWMSCALSFLLTFLRTAFLDWTVLFLVEGGASTWKAALESAVFPLTGAAGALFAGWYSDRVSLGRRGPVAALMLGLLVVSLVALALLGPGHARAALACIGAAGFLLLGPYSLLGGCLALDYGGKKAAATAAGINDGVGYLGGSASGLALGGVVDAYGWRTAFFVLAASSAVALVVAVVFLFTAERRAEPA
jgi:sugar phosphate permease